MRPHNQQPTEAETALREVRDGWVRIEQAALNVLRVAPDSEVAQGSLDLAREALSRGGKRA